MQSDTTTKLGSTENNRWETELKGDQRIRDIVERTRKSRGIVEEISHWFTATPRKKNPVDQASLERFYETGPELIGALVGAIACGQHVALAGPRGCGKSYCIGQAIKKAEESGIIPTRGSVKIQGNKELPRDYLIEDDMTLRVVDGKVMPERKNAPLFSFANRDADGRPVIEDGFVACFGRSENGRIIKKEKLQPHQRVVLFLDEVNRFSDGVLDSLLLLLEEGEAVMGGETFRLPCVVLMTMNPPGYDASARVLSPPLSARIGRQYRLLSPRLDILTDVIAPEALRRMHERLSAATNSVRVESPPTDLVRRAAAATLCCWGDPRGGRPGFDYLSEADKTLLVELSKIDTALKGAMTTLNELCHFGPDGRALGDWITAASVAARNEAEARDRNSVQPEPEHFVKTAVTVLSHKLQDNFSSASRPDNTRRKEEAIHVIASIMMDNDLIPSEHDEDTPSLPQRINVASKVGSGSPSTDSHIKSNDENTPSLLSRAVDDIATLGSTAALVLSDIDGVTMRDSLLDVGISENAEVQRWMEFLQSVPAIIEHSSNDQKVVVKTLLDIGILERDDGTELFSSNANKRFAVWLSQQNWSNKEVKEDAIKGFQINLKKIADSFNEFSYPMERTLGHYRWVRDGVLENNQDIRKLILERGLGALERDQVVALFEALDTVWIRAEHDGEDAAHALQELLKGWSESPSIASKEHIRCAKEFIVETIERMTEDPRRGGGTRRMRRSVYRSLKF